MATPAKLIEDALALPRDARAELHSLETAIGAMSAQLAADRARPDR